MKPGDILIAKKKVLYSCAINPKVGDIGSKCILHKIINLYEMGNFGKPPSLQCYEVIYDGCTYIMYPNEMVYNYYTLQEYRKLIINDLLDGEERSCNN